MVQTAKPHHIADDYQDATAERAFLAAVVADRKLVDLLLSLPAEVFVAEVDRYRQVLDAIEHDKPIAMPDTPAPDPKVVADYLRDLTDNRHVADLIETTAAKLGNMPGRDLKIEVEQAAGELVAQAPDFGLVQWAVDLMPKVLADAEARWNTRKETSRTAFGTETGISTLDKLLGGLNEGLYLLGGAPGMGKTSLAFQIAVKATSETPVVYASFENSMENLATKGVCMAAGVALWDVQNGYADPVKLRAGNEAWTPVAERLALIEGSSKLTVADLRRAARQAMKRHDTDKVLVVVDYLQLWSKASEEMRHRKDARESIDAMVSGLRQLATQLKSPVLVISSLNRAEGKYGDGKGAPSMAAFKESGDIEFAADVAMLLSKSKNVNEPSPAVALDLHVVKNRHGPTGKIELVFKADIGTIAEAENRYSDSPH